MWAMVRQCLKKNFCLVGFFSLFLCSISIYQAVVAGLREVDTKCTVPSFRMRKQSLGSAGLV